MYSVHVCTCTLYLCSDKSDVQSSADDDTDSSDDEASSDDMEDLISTLQRVYSEVCTPPPAEDNQEGVVKEEVGVVRPGEGMIVEDWVESDDDSSEDIVTTELEVFDKLEQTRSNLEDLLGIEKLMDAYTMIQVGGVLEWAWPVINSVNYNRVSKSRVMSV